jgi:hypothetical protein
MPLRAHMTARGRGLVASLSAIVVTSALGRAGAQEPPRAAPPAPPPPAVAPGAAAPSAPTAAAAPTAPAAATASELRNKGRDALGFGELDRACGLFAQSYDAAKAQGGALPPDEALYDLARCHERQGKAAVAAAEFDVIAVGSGPLAEEAKARAAALKAPMTTPGAPGIQASAVAPPAGASGGTAPSPPLPGAPSLAEESPTRIGDFMDTRLSFTLGDDDFLHQSGQTTPFSANWSIGDRRQYRLVFDNLNSRFAGRENLTHLALYKKMPGFIRDLDTEASLVVRLDIASLASNTNNLNQALYDAGSFVRAFYHTDGDSKGKVGLGVTLWPIDTDRFRLGYLYDISWGGTNAAINQSIFPRIQGSAPGGKIQYESGAYSVYVGFKTATVSQIEGTLTPGTSEVEKTRISQTNLGLLAGGSADITPSLHVDLGGGYFQQGRIEYQDVLAQQTYTVGGSGRVIVHQNMPVPQSIDFLLYRNDPSKPLVIFKPEAYEAGKTAWSASVEYTNLFQNLKSFETSGAMVFQSARAVALQANLKSGFFRASLTGIYRDLPYVLRNQPSFIPFVTLPKAATIGNEVFVAAAADYYIERARLTPGLGAGLQVPATFNTTFIDTSNVATGGNPILVNSTVVIRDQGNISILPSNRSAVPVFQARASLRWDISRIISAVLWAQFVHDNNGSFVARDPNEGTFVLRTFVHPDFFGLGTSVQARF